MHIRFGPSGNSQSFYDQGYTATKQAPEWLVALGLDAFEYSFGRGVRITQQSAEEIGEQMREHGIALSLHAPYYINLASEESKSIESTLGNFVKSAKAAQWMGGKAHRVPSGRRGQGPREIQPQNRSGPLRCAGRIGQTGLFRIDLLSRDHGEDQPDRRFGGDDPLLQARRAADPLRRFRPPLCAKHGNLRLCRGDYSEVLDKLINALGNDRAKRMHIHFSRGRIQPRRGKAASELRGCNLWPRV